MSSPDQPGLRRRRRRNRRPADDLTDTDRPIQQTGTAQPVAESGQDGAATRRRARATKPAGAANSADTKPVGAAKPVGVAKSTGAAKSGGAAKSTGAARSGGAAKSTSAARSGEPSARTIREAERGWRDLAGSGSSQLGVSGALRARDVSRPGPAELAEAERSVQLVRRQWQPPESG